MATPSSGSKGYHRKADGNYLNSSVSGGPTLDLASPKPDPEIYLLVARELELMADDCLVIEDSPAGVKAGLDAGMHVIAVSTPFTRDRLHRSNLLLESRIIDEHEQLPSVVRGVVDTLRETLFTPEFDELLSSPLGYARTRGLPDGPMGTVSQILQSRMLICFLTLVLLTITTNRPSSKAFMTKNGRSGMWNT